jgi:outer membrane receptor for ferrienterochelin and colicins
MHIRLLLFLLLNGCLVAQAQTAIQVVNANTNLPVADAFVYYTQLGNTKSNQSLKFADSLGNTLIVLKGTSLIRIHFPGYEVLFDTLQPGATSKIYRLKEINKILDQVVVTGQYDSHTADQSAIKINVINSARIEKQAVQNLAELLSNELNIRVANDAFIGSSMSLQGISGQNVKILLDGVPVTGRLNGNIDLSQMMLNNVDRIELIEGPMSVIYGTDALGGVINIITKKDVNTYRPIALNTYVENIGRYNFDGSIGIPLKNNKLLLSGGRYFFQGFTLDESNRVKPWKPKEQIFGDITYTFHTRKIQHRLYSQLYREKLISRGSATITPYEAYAFDDFYISWRNTNSLYSDIYFKNGSSLAFINSYAWYNRQKETYNRNLVTLEDTRINNTAQQDTNAFSHWLFRGTFNSHKMTSKFNFQTGYDVNYENGKGPRLANNKQEILDAALFYTAEYKPVSRLIVRPGLRVAYNSRFTVPVLPSLNVKMDITKNTLFRCSYARGYRAPSLKEMNLVFVDVNHNILGNPNLRAETSDNYQSSVQWLHRKTNKVLRIDLSAFYNQIKDMIALAVTNLSTMQYTYINIEGFRSVGGVINAEIRSTKYLVSVGAAYLGRSNQFANAANLPFVYTPELRSNFTTSLPYIKTDFSVFYKYNGKQLAYGVNQANKPEQTYINAYSIMDMNLSKRILNNQLYIAAGLKNMFNIVNINSTASAGVHSGSGQVLIGTGRSYFVTVKWNFGWKKS